MLKIQEDLYCTFLQPFRILRKIPSIYGASLDQKGERSPKHFPCKEINYLIIEKSPDISIL